MRGGGEQVIAEPSICSCVKGAQNPSKILALRTPGGGFDNRRWRSARGSGSRQRRTSHLDIHPAQEQRGRVNDVTQIFEAARQGDVRAAERLIPLVYDELRKLAAQKLAREAPGQTLQATALVHEAWLHLGGDDQPTWQNRAHFFGAAAEAMRRILVARAREKNARKRGGDLERAELEAIELPSPMPDEQLLALDGALERLATVDTRATEMVKLCFFVGLTQDEAAKEMGISLSTAERVWGFARAWLLREMRKQSSPGAL
jgi:RNA polymerase sigma factor (TIGR02999 family)